MSESQNPESSCEIADIEDAIRQAAADCGEPLTVVEYEDWRVETEGQHPSTSRICNLLGWRDACDRVGVQHGTRGGSHKWSERELLSGIEQAKEELGSNITCVEYDHWRETVEQEYPSAQVIIHRLGWCDACDRVGVEAGNVAYTRGDILSALKTAARHCGEPLRIADYREWRQEIDGDYPAQSRISTRVGWATACQKAGVESTGMGGRDYDWSDIKPAIQMAAAARGEPLTPEGYHQWRNDADTSHPPAITISNTVGWDEACEQAGVTTEGDHDGK